MRQELDDNANNPLEREQQYDDFVALLARHDVAIRRFVRYLLPSNDGVDDVIQETALECWKKFSEFQPVQSQKRSDEFVRWACVIARYKALSWQRDKSRDRLVFRESVVQRLSDAALEQTHHREEERSAVEICLKKLPDDQRRLVLSVHSAGESVARIAKESGQTIRKLYSRVNVLRSLLLDCIKGQLVEETRNG